MEENCSIPAKRLKTRSESLDKPDDGSNTHDDQESCVKSESADLPNPVTTSLSDQLLSVELRYNELFNLCQFESLVAYVYNPIDYAFELHSQFIRKFCQSQKEILILGMNPGPWGMSQTGIPFGEVSIVKNWLHINGEVKHPKRENPRRKVLGLECHRSEVTGKRFWEALKRAFGNDPYSCLKSIYIHNYCPLALMKESGRNITPAELKGGDKTELCRLCDDLLVEVLLLLGVKTIVAVGRFAEVQAKNILKIAGLDSIKLLHIPHPSPRGTVLHKNKNWGEETADTLKGLQSESAAL